jgi:hypothetical protein
MIEILLKTLPKESISLINYQRKQIVINKFGILEMV